MKSNNPFKVHNIEHLSASKINLWNSDPAKFIAVYLFGMTSSVGPAACRGTATEYALNQKLEHNWNDDKIDEYLYGTFEKECIENNLDIPSDMKAQKEQSALKSYYNNAVELYQNKKPEFYQHKIYYTLHEDLPVPFLGYIDFVFDDSIRDLKTTGRRPSEFSHGHQRQLAVYSKAFPEKEVWCDYVTPREAISFQLKNVEQRLKEVINISFGLMKFLSFSNDAYELASVFRPNKDSWTWNADNIKQSTKIWSND